MAASTTELELIAQLNSDKKNLRMAAIIKLAHDGASRESLQALSPFLTRGSREEALYATQAITKISKKLGIALPNDSSNNQQTNANSNGSVLTSKDFLEAKKINAPTILQYIRTNKDKLSEDVLPAVGVFLGKFGDKSDTPFIQNYLKLHNDNLTLPYISAAEKIDITILTPVLPYLLASNESLVRSRAVMALKKIDQEEAERHFLNILASKKAENRLSAVEISFLFPFERVKDYIIALLAEEKDPDVLKACATVLASNPSLEIALRLLDIAESQPVAQRKPTTTIFNIVASAINTAKVLPPEKATPQALVNAWKEQRLQNFLNDLEIQLSTTTGQKREAIINWLEKNIAIKQVSDFIEHLALNPQTEDVYQRFTNQNSTENISLPSIETILPQEETNSEHENTNVVENSQPNYLVNNPENVPLPEIQQDSHPAQTSSNIDSSSEKAQIRYLKKLEIEGFAIEKNRIIELAESDTVSAPLRAEALNTLLRLSPNIKIKQYGIKALEENDSKIKTAGFKILERVAPDVLRDRLSDLLLTNDDNIRIRAIRFGLKIDEAKSISALKKLVDSPDQNNRSNAINCLALCPFESVYEILMKALLKEKHPLVAKQITAIFINNPDPVVLSMIDKLCVITKDPSIEMVIQQTRSELEEILSSMPANANKSKLTEIDLFEGNIKQREEKPYSVENVRKLVTPTKKENTNKKDSNKTKNFIQENLVFVVTAAATILMFIVLLVIFLADRENGLSNMSKYKKENRTNKINERSVSRSSNKKLPNTLTLNKPCNIPGKILKIESGSIYMKYKNHDLYIKFTGNEASGFKVGDEVTVTCIPYRENPNGIVLSKGKKITKDK